MGLPATGLRLFGQTASWHLQRLVWQWIHSPDGQVNYEHLFTYRMTATPV